MASTPTKTVSAIVGSEKRLEFVINKLTEKTVARHDISIQGSPEKMSSKFGSPYVSPDTIQESKVPPKKEHFLRDDFGWVLGFSFSIPVFICVVIAIFIIGDVRSPHDNLVYGILGAIVGAIIGGILANYMRKHQLKKVTEQEKKGGYVLWVTVSSEEQTQEAVNILKQCHAREIKVE
ncbi:MULTISPECIES: hypothetical protein [unclassified Legionella]|uniref:hypothetical protein n=1 Tax=unclassified Legionella TaxID=2622702 RepID=UPI0010542ADF|nr:MULTISPECIES: hypothetical protein [unclassified Legionella]MDI9818672.1 hypothetical protein [Legionella sp. PL877]